MKRAFWLLLISFAAVLPGRTAGLILVHDDDFWRRPWPHPGPPPPFVPPPQPHPPHQYLPPPSQPVWAPLETVFTQVGVKIKDQIAVTSIEQEFYNPNSRQLEGTFLFPIPRGAQINKFTMEINGKPVEAELLAADKARGIYEDIVRRLKDPALLEYAGRDLFKVRIFPIEPNAKKRITLSYSQVLKADSGLVNFMFPLNTEKYSAKPLKTVSVKIDLESRRALKAIYSPSHTIEVKRHGDHQATIGYEASNVKPDTDFQLFYATEEGEVGLDLLAYKAGNDDGYFLLLASPAVESKPGRVMPKDVVFVLDTSGSMAGAKLEQAKKALAFCVENLNDNDRFEILRFATEVEPLFDKLADASKENRGRAQTFIKELKPIGGTAINDALRKALALRPEKRDRPCVIVFLTDGRPTVGNTDENQIVANVASAGKGSVRVFCFGIGTDVNTHLLDRITEETKASSQYVLPEEDIEVKVSSFFSKIKEPVLANLKLNFPDGVRVTKLYPAPLPDLFKGEQLVVAGRYSGKGSGKVELEGSIGGETKKISFEAKFPDDASDHEFIPRLWATRRVGYLLDEIRLRGENTELKDEVVELARKYSIVTPYTAYLINEDEQRRGVAANVQSYRFLSEDEGVRQQVAQSYSDFNLQKDGGLAVGGARSFSRLKSADAPSEAIMMGNADAFRAAPQSAPPAIVAGRAVARGSFSSVTAPATVAAAKEFTEQSRYVQGRTFYRNGEQWVDAEAQKLAKASRVRVQFDSPEYFDLLKKHPKALPWLALGRNLQLALDGTVYEIYE